jgi:hypothetical protein
LDPSTESEYGEKIDQRQDGPHSNADHTGGLVQALHALPVSKIVSNGQPRNIKLDPRATSAAGKRIATKHVHIRKTITHHYHSCQGGDENGKIWKDYQKYFHQLDVIEGDFILMWNSGFINLMVRT